MLKHRQRWLHFDSMLSYSWHNLLRYHHFQQFQVLEVLLEPRFFWNQGSSRTKLLIMSNESFVIYTSLISSSCLFSSFSHLRIFIFGTNRLTTLQSCNELISILLGALAVGICDLIILFVSLKTSDNWLTKL